MQNLEGPSSPQRSNKLMTWLRTKRTLPTWGLIVAALLLLFVGSTSHGSSTEASTTSPAATTSQSQQPQAKISADQTIATTAPSAPPIATVASAPAATTKAPAPIATKVPPATATSVPPTATPVPAPAPTLQTIASFAGSGQKNTADFHIDADQWQIAWACQPGQFGGNFSIEVTTSNGTYVDLAANEICSSNKSDVTIERGAGDYFLKVSADAPWQIQIKAIQ